MKKSILIIMSATMLMLAGCGNMAWGIGNFKFRKIHIDTHNYNGCFTVEKWLDSTTGIEVKTKEAGSLFVSEGMYVLIEDKCPFCD